MGHITRFGAGLAGLLLAAGAGADDTIKVARTVAYKDVSVGTANVRQECDWNTRMVDHLVEYSHGAVIPTDEDLSQVQGRALRLVTVGIHTSGGGGWSGPKWIKIRGELLVDGKVVNNFQKTSHSGGGMSFSGCSVANKMGKQLGAWVAKWLQNPSNMVDNEGIDDDKGGDVAPAPGAAPKGAEAPPATPNAPPH